MFCGCTFASSGDTFVSHAADSYAISSMVIQNAVFDEIYVTIDVINTDTFDGSIPDGWTFNTRLHALFQNDLYGGNVSFTEDIVDLLRIKKRTSKDSRFQTIFEKQIKNNEDFAIEFIDYLEPAGTIEYAYVPVLSGGENKYIISTVESSFDSCFLVEKGKSYPIVLDSSYSETINYETGQVRPLGRKYPITIVNGDTGYRSGEIEGTFIEYTNENADVRGSFDYRHLVYDFLTNSRPKILKDLDGNLLMIHVSSNLSESSRSYCYRGSDGFYYVKSKFSFVESGDAYQVSDLYDNDFIDIDLDRQVI
ncbi:MAG: hypothetical protein ACRDBO_02640 [Lachnospiraceae bacterium]